MSRIEDDREAAREAERLLQKQRQEEVRQKERVQSETRFSERLATQNAQRARAGEDASKQHQERKESDKNTSQKAKQFEAQVSQEKGTRETLEQAQARRWLAERGDRWRSASEGEAQAHVAAHAQSDHSAVETAHGRSSDDGDNSQRGDSRKKSADAQSDAHGLAAEGKSKDKLSTDGEGKGKGGQDGQSKDQEPSAASFRLNPALLAPVPVAKPKETSASERLRALANEIAQKIVERVRIGTNAAGVAEFQIDLRSNVLSGLNIQVSGTKGRISAVFSGRDSKVLKLLREQSESLKKALEGRGLKLAELRIEERP